MSNYTPEFRVRPRVAQRFLLAMLGLAIAAGSLACDGCDRPEDPPVERAERDVGVDADEEALVEPQDLAPRFRVVEATVPTSIEILLARDVTSEDPDDSLEAVAGFPRPAPLDTRVEITPDVDGTVYLKDPATLEFRADEPLRPDTEYTVRLLSVGTPGSTLTPDEAWSFTFETPRFELLGASSAVVDENSGLTFVDLHFSAPPNLATIREKSTWRHQNTVLSNVSYEQGYGPHIVRAALKTQGPTNLRFKLDEGATWAHDSSVRAPAFLQEISIRTGPPVHLHGFAATEGHNGYYVQVICQDTAEGGSRYYWSSELRQSYRVSRRCMPDEESIRNAIQISPDVDIDVVPGRGGFNLVGDFKRGTHRIRVDAGLTTVDGGVLASSVETDLEIKARKPQLEFVNTGRYIPRSRWNRLTLRHLNVHGVDVEVRHIPRENLLFWLSQDDEAARASVANVVARQTVDLDDAPEDSAGFSVVEAADLIGEAQPGVYELTAQANGASDAVRLMVTDLSLIAKRSAAEPDQSWSNEILVWALDTTDASPRLGVEVEVVRASGKAMGRCTTNSEGRCTLEVEPETIDPNGPVALIANDGDDFTYLKFSELETDTSGFATHGEPYLEDSAYRAATYSSRDLFRPGEDAHFVAILRDRANTAPVDLPVELILTDARQNPVRQIVERTNEAGMVELSHTLNDFAATGAYTLEAKVGKRTVGTYRFHVEEFVPERIQINADFESDSFLADQIASLNIEANYLFGASASGSDVELTCRVEHDAFTPPGLSDFTFGLAALRNATSLELEKRAGSLDDDGQATMECPAFDELEYPSGSLVGEVAVFEAGSGRTSKSSATARLHAEPHHIGLKAASSKLETGDPLKVEGVVVDEKGKPFNDLKSVDVEFIRLERQHYWYQGTSDQKNTWGHNLNPVVEGRQTVDVRGGKFTYRAAATRSGAHYVVRAVAGKAATELTLKGSGGYPYWRDRPVRVDQTPRPSRATELQITGPDTTQVGQDAAFKVEVPFKGRLLMTVETHRVVEHAWFDVDEGAFDWKFALEKFAPNVYVSGLLIKDPYAESTEAFVPQRAFGTQSVRVLPVQHTHEVELQTPSEVEPNTELEIIVDIKDATQESTFVTVAAVDEGILSITDFETPDPNQEIFARRALGVSTFETIGWAIESDPSDTTSSTGGGGDMMEPPGAPSGREFGIKPVALWSGLVKVDDGKARVILDVPRYRGKLRIMAVAASPDRIGHAESTVTVRDPLVLQTTLPRFLSAGDEAHIPVFATNMTGASGTLNVTLETETLTDTRRRASEPVIEVVGESSKSLDLAQGESATVVFAVRGLRQAGTARFRVDAKLGNVRSYDEGIVPFRPNGPQERRVQSIELTSGVNPLQDALSGWVPTSERTSVWVTPNPFGTAFSHLDHLISYPYGCLEQTVSRTRPMLFVEDLIKLNAPDFVAKNGGIEAMVESGIRRVLSMQRPDGSFSYWPTSTSASPWASAYATHFLLDARERGYTVPSSSLDRALNWLSRAVDDPVARNRYRSSHHAYAHLVLAKGDKGKPAQALRMIRDAKPPTSGTEVEEHYMLKAALYLAGDRRYEKDLKALDNLQVVGTRDDRYSYYSDKRRNAFILATFIDIFGNEEAARSHLQSLAGDLQQTAQSTRFTTQEITWSVTALGKWIAGQKGSFSKPVLRLGTQVVEPDHESDANERTWSIHRASEYDSIDVRLDDVEGKVYAILSSTGVRTNPEVKYGGQALRISRTFHAPDGSEVTPSGHTLGDLVYSKITIRNTTRRSLYNLALVDRIAAGWEIENPRLSQANMPDWIDSARLWNVEHMDLRDDRIEVFGGLAAGQEVTFVYAMRSATSGVFFAPGPQVEGMYDPDVWARSSPARVTIEGPWDDFLN